MLRASTKFRGSITAAEAPKWDPDHSERADSGCVQALPRLYFGQGKHYPHPENKTSPAKKNSIMNIVEIAGKREPWLGLLSGWD